MTERKVSVIYPDTKRTVIQGAGDEYSYLATTESTDGHYFLMDALVPPGGGPPPHIQTREEEGFYILEGEVNFFAEGKTITATAGTFLNIPKGVVHNFKNESDADVRMLIFFAPSGIEKFFAKAAANPDNYIELAKEAGVKFV